MRVKTYDMRSITTITLTGYNIAEFFYYYTGEYSDKKTLHPELVFGPDENKKEFLTGWMEGDGCISDRNRLIGITVSNNLTWQVRCMLNSLLVKNHIRYVESKGRKIIIDPKYGEYSCKNSWRLEIFGGGYEKFIVNNKKYTFEENITYRKRSTDFVKIGDNKYCLHLINKVNKEKFIGKIIEITTESDDNITVNGVLI